MNISDQYQAFYNACDELRSAKIIIADAKVSKILRSVINCSPLLEIIGEALVGFNYQQELSKATDKTITSGSRIILPSEPYKVIALVFTILNEIDAKNLDLQEFVAENFPQESLIDSFRLFANSLIIPFRDYLCQWVGFKEAPKQEEVLPTEEIIEECEVEATQDPTDLFFEDVVMILNQIKETIKLDTKIKKDRLDELNITINALIEVCDMRNFKIFNALLISLNNLISPVKSVRFYNMELQNRIAKFYGL